ncbi:iron-containing alcohol dehydrogenase [Tissierella sp. Yu-01]|uniref:iron-containing alcohol dehydrogenase n=1 Tax=Tissierella sp. Yu-01 TaxID=3035694 RepID=UPI00240CF5F7|nr:iron-containing alcohol dehydrogenase [Tissierella sp. Yu-01]WFA08535.1 iron-containing alcohol dehydrogenase [Tissierella sp. Yu-01]
MKKMFQMGLPRRVIAGEGATSEILNIVEESGLNNILLLADGGAYKAGSIAKIEEMLSGFNVTLLNDSPPEPEYKQVLETYNRMKDNNIEMIVAVGGGSIMDTAKILSVISTNPEYAKDLLNPSLIKKRGLLTIFVPTSAGTGSEATQNSIVVVPEKELKVGLVNSNFIPDYVILDAEMTIKLPPSVTAATGVDAFCHAIECYISKKANPFSDMYALKAINLISKNLRKAYTDGSDISARENMLLAAFYGGLCIASSSTVAVHALSYPLGGKYRIPHGVSNAILLPFIMEYNADHVLDKFRDVAIAMEINIENRSKEEIGKLVVEEIFNLTKDLNIPNSLKEYGITSEDLDGLVEAAAGVTRLLDNNPKVMSKEDIRNIYMKLM